MPMWSTNGMNQLEAGQERGGKGRRKWGSETGHVGRGAQMRKEGGEVEEQGRET